MTLLGAFPIIQGKRVKMCRIEPLRALKGFPTRPYSLFLATHSLLSGNTAHHYPGFYGCPWGALLPSIILTFGMGWNQSPFSYEWHLCNCSSGVVFPTLIVAAPIILGLVDKDWCWELKFDQLKKTLRAFTRFKAKIQGKRIWIGQFLHLMNLKPNLDYGKCPLTVWKWNGS